MRLICDSIGYKLNMALTIIIKHIYLKMQC